MTRLILTLALALALCACQASSPYHSGCDFHPVVGQCGAVGAYGDGGN